MRKTIILIGFASVLTAAAPAQAQGRSGFGLGVETTITSEFGTPFPGVATFTYDTGTFQIGGMFTLVAIDDTVTIIGAGGRFYYGIHRGERSDFAIGGGLALINSDPAGGGDSTTDFHLEGGAKIRAFITPNVALTTALGLGIILADNDGGDQDVFGIVGNLTGAVGISYYFW
jgi:hypothetical protein